MNTKLVKDFTKVCSDGYALGWHERNGGNLSYRMKEEEVEEIKDLLNEDAEWREIGTEVPDLKNEYFMVTGSGKYFRNVELDFEDNVAVIRVNEDGSMTVGCLEDVKEAPEKEKAPAKKEKIPTKKAEPAKKAAPAKKATATKKAAPAKKTAAKKTTKKAEK